MLRALGGIGFASAFTFLLLEVGVRIFLPQVLVKDAPDLWSPDEAMGWRRKPDVRLWVNSGERDAQICTDSRGDRIDCDAPEPDACVARVLVVGDSFVEALAIPYADTVWSRLERDTGACLDVAGVGAYGPPQYLKLTRDRVAAAQPRYDLVLYNFYVGNDFVLNADQIPPPTEVQRRPFRLLPPSLDLKGLGEWFYPFNSWLEGQSHAYVALRFAIRRLQDPGDVGIHGVPISLRSSSLTEDWLATTASSAELAAEAAEAAGARFVVAVIPHRSQVLDPQAEKLLRGLPRLEGDIDMELVKRKFVPRLRASGDVDAVVDLLDYLRAHATKESWGTRDAHLSPDGHRLWFEAVRPEVRRALGL